MASQYLVKKNDAAGAAFPTFLAPQTPDGTYKSNPTLATGDAKISIDGGAFANLATLPDVDPNSSKAVKIVLSQAETNGDNLVIVLSDAAGAEWCDRIICIQTVSQRIDDLASQASVNTIDDFLDTEVAAIKAKTDNLPSDPADASDIAAAFATVGTNLSTIAGYLDTEVAAIKAKTDNLPAAPAAVGDIPTAVQNADALLNRDLATGTDSGSSTVRTVRQALRFLRNKFTLSGGTLTVYKENDTTASWTAAVGTDVAADPVVSSDPAGP